MPTGTAAQTRYGKNEFVAQLGPIWHGRFRLAIDDPAFSDTGQITRPTIVFPREPVRITQAGADPVVADPNTIMCYDPDRPYRRDALSPRGDRCEWFGFDADLVEQIAAAGGARPKDPARPFAGRTHLPCQPALFAEQRRIAEQLRADRIDRAEAEERLMAIVARAVASVSPARSAPGRRRSTADAHRQLVEHAKQVLATRFDEPITLTDVAGEVYASPYHLSRVFRARTGATMHAYLTSLRLAAALDRLEGGATLMAVARAVGFSSHSHFTVAFGKVYGLTPKRWRAAIGTSPAKRARS